MSQDIFISYASVNSALAEAVCRFLEEAGHGCWIAPRDIQGGISWSDAIMQALDQCRVVVLLLSSASNISVQVHNEINEATNLKKPIVPVRIEDVVLSKHMAYYLGRLQLLTILRSPIEAELPILREAVQSLLAGGKQVAASPDPAISAISPEGLDLLEEQDYRDPSPAMPDTKEPGPILVQMGSDANAGRTTQS